MNKPENSLNSLDPSLVTFTTHNFYSPKIICISFTILEKEKNKHQLFIITYNLQYMYVHDSLFRVIERHSVLARDQYTRHDTYFPLNLHAKVLICSGEALEWTSIPCCLDVTKIRTSSGSTG